MKQWQLDAAREELLLELNTLLEEMKHAELASNDAEYKRLSREVAVCLEFAERQGFTYSVEELSLCGEYHPELF